MNVRDLMSDAVVSVEPQASLKEVARLLIQHRIGGVPVVDEDGAVLGVVSETDFVRKERRARGRPSLFGNLFAAELLDRLEAGTAGEAMTSPALTIEPDATAREAAGRMMEFNINRLPVVERGRLVGIVTRGDLVRLFAEPDATIAGRIREALRAVDGLSVEDVTDGVVTLAGTVHTRALADTAVTVAESIDGVVAVRRERLGWRSDEERRREGELDRQFIEGFGLTTPTPVS